jgi:LemA protein
MKKILIVLAVLFGIAAIVAVVLFSKGVGIYNQIVVLEEGVRAQWAQVENTYQRRYDLIPNLVATVQGEADFEKGTLTAVIDARSRMGGVVKVDPSQLGDPQTMQRYEQAQASLGGALQRLLMVTENYPNLKANQAFQDLRVQLEGSENRISVERKRYNESVQAYNTFIRQFPNSLLAGFAGAVPKVPFAAQSEARTAPKVEFKK